MALGEQMQMQKVCASVRGFRLGATHSVAHMQVKGVCRFGGGDCCNVGKKGCQGCVAAAWPVATATSLSTLPVCRNSHPHTL